MVDSQRANLIASLETNLRRQCECYDRLLVLLKRKRDAIAAADASQIAHTCREERAVLLRVEELERERQELVAQFSSELGPDVERAVSLRGLRPHLPERDAGRLEVIAQQVRSRVAEVQRMSGVLRAAADALRHHVNGIMHVVHGALQQARTYERHGALATSRHAVSTIDVTT